MFLYSALKVVHILAIAYLFYALGGNTLHAAIGGERSQNRLYGLTGALHGIAILAIVVAGFGMLTRFNLGDPGFPLGWVLAKILIWLALGAWVLVPYRQPAIARRAYPWLPLIAAVAATLAIFKPF